MTVLAFLLTAVATGVVVAYLAGARRVVGEPDRRRRSRVNRWSWASRHWRRYAFCAGVVTTVVSLLPAFDARVDDSFVLHMTQHLVLMWVAAPLLALGAPGLPLLLALPRRWRRAVNGVRGAPAVRRVRVLLAAPVVIGLVDAVVVLAWHLPSLYTAALSSDLVHAAEHLSLLLVSWLLWAPLAAPHRRLQGGAAVLYVFLTGFPMVAVGAALVLATHPLYPAQTGTGAGAIAAQQTAGVLMWIPPTFLSLLLCAALVLAWFRSMERVSPGGAAMPPPIPPVLSASGEVPR